MGYRAYMTREGYAIQAKLFAEGGNFEITRVAIGSGRPGQGDDPAQFAALVEERAPATSTKVRRAGCEVAFAVEYRSELTPEVTSPFQINELGVFATGVEGDEVLALYVDLSACPDTAVPLEYGGCVRRWPINITVGPDATVSLAYPAGAWMTHEEAEDIIAKALKKGLDMGDGTSVPEAVGAMQEDLAKTKADVAAKIDAIQSAVDKSIYYRKFEPEDWTAAGDGARLRIPPSEHEKKPTRDSCLCKLRMRIGRNAVDVRLDADAAAIRAAIIAAQQEALAANAAAASSEEQTETETYPTAADGHVILTWDQVQYYILDGVLVPAELAAQAAQAKGFAGWAQRPVEGAEETATLDQVLSAAYAPAMGTPAAAFDELCTADALRGLRIRKRADGLTGTVEKYDLDGVLTEHTWGALESRVNWDTATKDLVIAADSAFSGDLMVMG